MTDTVAAVNDRRAELTRRIGELEKAIADNEVREAEARREALADSSSSYGVTRKLIDDRHDLIAERDALQLDAVELDRLRDAAQAAENAARKREVIEEAAVIQGAYAAGWAKAGKWALAAEQVFAGIAEPAMAIDRLYDTQRHLFDDPTEKSEVFKAPFGPVPQNVAAFAFRVFQLATSDNTRPQVSPQLREAIPKIETPDVPISWTPRFPNQID